MRNVLIVLLLAFSTAIIAQNECKVLLEDLSGNYEGDCRKGLAHGKGKAVGIDSYSGKFKKGYPEGRGTYNYADGSFYKGEFKKGRREGKGRYVFYTDEGKKMEQDGYWEDDRYIGPKKIKPYKVKMRRNIDRYTISRINDGNDIRIFLKQNGRNNPTISNLMINGSSGQEMSVSSYLGFKNVEFPFTCKLRYTTQNKLQTSSYEVLFEFEIIKPGKWNVNLHN